jgi:hypothetical protein
VSGLNAGPLALVGNSFVRFVRAFDSILELTVFRRHSMDNLVGAGGGAGHSVNGLLAYYGSGPRFGEFEPRELITWQRRSMRLPNSPVRCSIESKATR